MLAVTYYRSDKTEEAVEVLEHAVKFRRKRSPLESLRLVAVEEEADGRGTRRARTRNCCGRGRRLLKENLTALQNQKPMRMKGYGEQWYQFGLERPKGASPGASPEWVTLECAAECADAGVIMPTPRLGRYTLIVALRRAEWARFTLAVLMGRPTSASSWPSRESPTSQATEFVSKFIDEANLMVQLHHGNIVPVLELADEAGELYLVMEYLPGRDLKAVIRRLRERRERMNPDLALWLTRELCADSTMLITRSIPSSTVMSAHPTWFSALAGGQADRLWYRSSTRPAPSKCFRQPSG